jgi:polyhydroxyalkanoate synthesis regulator phasin
MSDKQTRLDDISDRARAVGNTAVGLGRNMIFVGLGAIATMDSMVRRAGDELIRRGREYDSPGMDRLRGPVRQATESVRGIADDVTGRVRTTTTGILQKAGLPTDEEIRLLIDRVEALTKKVSRLEKHA